MSLKKNFASRLSLYVVLFAAGLMVVVSLMLGIFSSSAIRNISRRMAESQLDRAILEIEQVITEVERAVDNLDWVVEQHLDNEEFLYEVTRQIVAANPNIIGSAIAFEPGFYKGRKYFSPYTYIGDQTHEIHTIQMGNENYDYPILDWYQIPKLLEKPYWSDPYFDDGGGGQAMSTYSMPLRDADGHIFGIITADISLAWLSRWMSGIKPYANSYSMLVGRNGSFIAHPDSSKVLNETIFTVAMELADTTAFDIGKAMLAGKKGMQRFVDKGQDSFMVYGPISNGWSMGIVNLYADIFRHVRHFNMFLAALLFLGTIAMFIGCRRTIGQLTMPIVEFSNSAMTMAKGNFKAVIPEVETKDELMKLRNSLSYMQQSINEYIVELKSTTASNERYESELNIARDIQMSMLPKDFPERDDLSLFAMVQPAKEVGGDLYDFHVVGDVVFFLVGDVSGKGVPASLFMAIARAAFRFIGALGLPMHEVMRRVNDCLCDGNTNGMFVTIFAGRLDLKTGRLDYCNAGHNPIVVIGPDGKASFLKAKPNLAAGLFENFPYEDETLQIERGTRLVLYTDGVTEAERADKQQYGEDQLLEWAGRQNPQTASNLVVADLFNHVKHFTKGADQNDDITIMSVLLK